MFLQSKDKLSMTRDRIIEGRDIKDIVNEVFTTTGNFLANKAIPLGTREQLVSGDLLIKQVEPRFFTEWFD